MNSPHWFQNSSVVEAGLSDFHSMIITVLTTTFHRLSPKIRIYRDYSNFDNWIFWACLLNDLSKQDVVNLEKFIKVCINTLNNHARSKKKYIRDNHLPFINKELSKAIINQTRWQSIALRSLNCQKEIVAKHFRSLNCLSQVLRL